MIDVCDIVRDKKRQKKRTVMHKIGKNEITSQKLTKSALKKLDGVN